VYVEAEVLNGEQDRALGGILSVAKSANLLEVEFEAALREAAQTCIRECKYRPTYFLAMLGERGGVATAKALLSKPSPSEGFTKLVVDLHRPQLTVEHFVSDSKYHTLFSREEIGKAKRWLGHT
jgi:hypothetical protein